MHPYLRILLLNTVLSLWPDAVMMMKLCKRPYILRNAGTGFIWFDLKFLQICPGFLILCCLSMVFLRRLPKSENPLKILVLLFACLYLKKRTTEVVRYRAISSA